MFKKLPEPDDFGNYWLKTHARAPAVLKGGKGDGGLAENGARTIKNDREHWFVSVGEGELLFHGDGVIRYFATPQLALEALNEAM